MALMPPWQLQGAREVAYALGIDAVTDGSGKRLGEGMRQVASETDLYREKEHILSIEKHILHCITRDRLAQRMRQVCITPHARPVFSY